MITCAPNGGLAVHQAATSLPDPFFALRYCVQDAVLFEDVEEALEWHYEQYGNEVRRRLHLPELACACTRQHLC